MHRQDRTAAPGFAAGGPGLARAVDPAAGAAAGCPLRDVQQRGCQRLTLVMRSWAPSGGPPRRRTGCRRQAAARRSRSAAPRRCAVSASPDRRRRGGSARRRAGDLGGPRASCPRARAAVVEDDERALLSTAVTRVPRWSHVPGSAQDGAAPVPAQTVVARGVRRRHPVLVAGVAERVDADPHPPAVSSTRTTGSLSATLSSPGSTTVRTPSSSLAGRVGVDRLDPTSACCPGSRRRRRPPATVGAPDEHGRSNDSAPNSSRCPPRPSRSARRRPTARPRPRRRGLAEGGATRQRSASRRRLEDGAGGT